MSGAFHGVIAAAGPAGIRWTRFQVPFERQSRALFVGAMLKSRKPDVYARIGEGHG